MRVKKPSKVLTRRLRRRSREARELAAQLAPLEELSKSRGDQHQASQVAAQEDGAIVIGGQPSNFANEINESGSRKSFLGLDPVVIVIVGLMLAFIAFIAWLVSRLPPASQ